MTICVMLLTVDSWLISRCRVKLASVNGLRSLSVRPSYRTGRVLVLRPVTRGGLVLIGSRGVTWPIVLWMLPAVSLTLCDSENLTAMPDWLPLSPVETAWTFLTLSTVLLISRATCDLTIVVAVL